MKNAPLFPKLRIVMLGLSLFAALALIAIFAQPASAQTETVLYTFCSLADCADGDTPEGGLIVDAAGNLYGTTMYGGSNPNGGMKMSSYSQSIARPPRVLRKRCLTTFLTSCASRSCFPWYFC